MKCSEENFKKFFHLTEIGQIKSKIAAKALGYTPAHFSRLCGRYREIGDRIFVHGLKGRPGNRTKLGAEARRFIGDRYLVENSEECPINFRYWRDELEECHGAKYSYTTVYRELKNRGIESPERHRKERERTHRTSFRRRSFGELVQWDATPYQWFLWAGDTRYYTLHGALDDSRSTFLALYMTEFECRYGYIECRRQVLTKYGIELEDYSDRSPVFSNNAKESPSVEEQLSGVEKKKPLWEAMNEELKIGLHLANSPQAKGKIERAWETVQGRLPNELKKRGIRTMEGANAFLEGEFRDYYAEHFGTNGANVSVFRTIPEGTDLENVLCVKERRRVEKSGCVRFKGLKVKIRELNRTGVFGEVCVSQRGIWFLYDGRRHEVELSASRGLSADVPQVLENIISEFFYSSQHFQAA